MTLEKQFPGINMPAEKAYRHGTHRAVSPQETMQRLQPLLRPLGITRVANVTGLDRIGIPTVMVCRPNSRVLAVSQGKGLRLDEAKASGVMESIESYHAERIRSRLRLASLKELRRRARVVDVDRLPRRKFSPFRTELPILWIEGMDLFQSETAWLPFELVHLDFTLTDPSAVGCFAHGSNGLSSGNHHWESILHGICEVVERDAMTLWSLTPHALRAKGRIHPESIKDNDIQSLLQKYASNQIEVGLWDITTDVGIPVIACCICEAKADPFYLRYSAHGFGCHPSRKVAAIRALTEAAQGRLTIIAGTRDDNPRTIYRKIRGAEYVQDERDFVMDHHPAIDFAECVDPKHDDFALDVRWALDRLRAAGVSEVIAVNLSLPELDIPVTRVVIPGMEILVARPDRYFLTDEGHTRMRSLGWK